MPTAMQRLLGKETAPASSPSPASGKEEAAQDLIDAVKDGDAKAVSLAFAALYEHCAGEGHDEGADEDDDEPAYGG